MSQHICFSCLIVLLLLIGTQIQSAPLIQLLPYNRTVTLNAGDKMTLVCPVVSSKFDVIYEWNLERYVDLFMGDIYELFNDSRVLVAKSVIPSMSQLFKCSGSNGFGQKTASFDVKILERPKKYLCASKSKYPSIEEPCFMTKDMKNGTRNVEAEVGKPLTLDCTATGTEPLVYQWFFGPNSANWLETKNGTNRAKLEIKNILPSYGGIYKCIVSNKAGKLQFTYRVRVIRYELNIPKILTKVVNRTYDIGETVTIRITVKCLCKKPMVWWLKRVHENADMRGVNEQNAIQLPNPRESEDGEKFISLQKNSDMKAIGNNLFESTMVLEKMNVRDEGKYIVAAINTMNAIKEYDYKVMYFNLNSDEARSRLKNNSIIYISVPIVILLSTVLMIIFCCLRRHANSSQGYSRSNNSTHNNVNNGCQGNSGSGTVGTNIYRSSGRRQNPYSNGSSALLPSNGCGNDSSQGGSEKMKAPSTNNSSIGMVTTNNNNSIATVPQPISSQQSTYDQYSVLSVSQSSHSTPSQNAPYYHQNLLNTASSGIQYPPPTTQYQPPHTTTVQYPNPYHPGYMPVPINQYPA